MDLQEWVERARQVPIESEITRRHITLKRSGAERIGPCPKCGGKDRFSINVVQNVWNCRQCKPDDISGDVIGLVEWLDDCGFDAACETLTHEPRPNGKDDISSNQSAWARIAEAAAARQGKAKSNGGGNGHDASAKPSASPLGPPTAIYDYVDESGKLLYQVVRYNVPEKTFRQRRPDGNGGWIANTKGIAMVPYHLPELVEAIAFENIIFIPEGEADVDTLVGLGAPATTNPRGAGKWGSCNIDGYFADANLVVIADNDPQTKNAKGELLYHQDGRPRFVGWDHAHDVAAHLNVVAGQIRVMDLKKFWPQCPDKGDVSDFIAAGGTLDQLYDWAEQIDPWVPGDELQLPAIGYGVGNNSTALGEWDLGDDPGPIPPREWLLGNQFCCRYISSLVAAGGVGKSSLRLLQLISLASGRPLCRQHIFRRCKVLLISLEDDRLEVERRVQAVLYHYSIDRAELKGWMFCATPIGSKLAEQHGNKRAVGVLDQQIRDAIARHKPDIVAIDPFVKLHALEENDAGDMNYVAELLVRIAVETGIAVDIPHHVHKGDLKPGDADAGRGSSGIRDAGRLIYTLTVMSETEAKSFDVDPDERFSYVRLDSAKVNLAVRSGVATWFKLVGVPINNGDATYPAGDTIQVAEPWKPKDPWDGLPIDAILNYIDAGCRDEFDQLNGERFSNAPKAADRAVWPVIQRFVPDRTEPQCRFVINTWFKNGVLKVVTYYSQGRRQNVTGLAVDPVKRPGTTTED